MSNLILKNSTTASKLKEKDCNDFYPMPDGTFVGDVKYCKYSFICRQMGMRSDYIWYTGPGLVIHNGLITDCYYTDHYDYFCTGKYIKKDEKGVDEEVS